jgi:hypothetical protein
MLKFFEDEFSAFNQGISVFRKIPTISSFILQPPRVATDDTHARTHTTLARSIFDSVSYGLSAVAAVTTGIFPEAVGGLADVNFGLDAISLLIGDKGEAGERLPGKPEIEKHPFVRKSKVGQLVKKFIFDEITTNDLSPDMRQRVDQALRSKGGQEFEKFLKGKLK